MDRDNLLEMNGITKAYPGVMALDSVTFKLRAGEVHALAGENGAGKSTLIKVLSGAVVPDAGEIVLEGRRYKAMAPAQAIALGINVIYQELNLVPYLSVAENIFLGNETAGRFFLDKAAMHKKTKALLDSMGIGIEPDTKVKALTIAYRQLVEVAKAISHHAKILVMDEPTSPLSNCEVESLFAIIEALKKKGVSIIYISHRMEEIFRICDRVTVMRDGQYVDTLDVKATDRKQLISLMVGRELTETYPQRRRESDRVVLRVENVSGERVSNISFDLYGGEILGFAGLVGAGRTEIARVLFGVDKMTGGSVTLNGTRLQIGSPSDAIESGIGLIPEDRKTQGLILELPVRHNVSLANLAKLVRTGILSEKAEKELVEGLAKRLGIKASGYGSKVKQLSGGNQQKVVLAKWLATSCKVLIFDEPTRGIDVRAKHEIYQLMRKLTEEGVSIIMISSDMPELMGMSDRMAVVHDGKIKACLDKCRFSQERILDIASGGAGDVEA